MAERGGQITQVLADVRAGVPHARATLVELVYAQLHALAGRQLRRRPNELTLQPTVLVHEAYVRLVGQDDVHWNDRAHFFSACATVMRNILSDHARRRRAQKRGGGARPLTIGDALAGGTERTIDLVALDEALSELSALNERHARVVECRFFAGMTVPEVAAALGVAERTVDNDWAMARAWLSARLSASEQA